MDKEIIDRAEKIVNVFENDSGSQETDYSTVYIYRDGPGDKRQVTIGRGFTSMGGNLWKVLQRYIDKGGELSDFFAGYKSKMSQESLCDDKKFLSNLVKASKNEQKMKDSQDEIFEEIYLKSSFDYFDDNGFKENLSFAVIVDSMLHSGSILNFLTNSFKEKKPANGGNEKKWIESYVAARDKWLRNHSKKILRNTVYRTEFFQSQIKKKNWKLDLPLTANGTKIT